MEVSSGNQLDNMKKTLFCLIPLFLLSSCGKSGEDIVDDPRDYQDYAEFSLNSIDELYSKEEENYLVEIYFPECSHCKNNRKFSIISMLKRMMKHLKKCTFLILNHHQHKKELKIEKNLKLNLKIIVRKEIY